MPIQDLPIGSKFDELTVDSEKFVHNKKSYVWCNCSCGNRKKIRVDALKPHQVVRSCGCKHSYYTGKNHNKRKGSLEKDGKKKCRQCLELLPDYHFQFLEKAKDKFRPECILCRYKNEGYTYKIGHIFGNLEIYSEPFIYLSQKSKVVVSYYCKCKCGSVVRINSKNISLNKTLDCGCENSKKRNEFFSDGLNKKCRGCLLIKSVDNFSSGKSRDNKNSRCIDCIREQTINGKYGITNKQYDDLLKLNNGCCHCCNKKLQSLDHRTNKLKKLPIDHCHKTKLIRGILCSRCNTAIGLLGDDLDGVSLAFDYLKKFESSLEKV